MDSLIDFYSHFSCLTQNNFKTGWNLLFEAALNKYGEKELKKLIFKNLLLNNYKDERMISTLKYCKSKLKSITNINNKMVQKYSRLGSIPKDLLQKIFRYLSEFELNTEQQVCRDFVGTATSVLSFHKNHFKLIIPSKPENLCAKLKTYFDDGRYKDISKLIVVIPSGEMDNKYDAVSPRISDVFPKIETLELLSYQPTRITSTVLGQFKNIKNIFLDSVDISNCLFEKSYEDYEDIHLNIGLNRFRTGGLLRTFVLLSTKIKILSIYDYIINFQVCTPPFKNLEALRVNWFRAPDSMSRIVCNAPNMQYLSVYCCQKSLTGGTYSYYRKHCDLNNVKEFHLQLGGKCKIDFCKLFGWTNKNKPKNVLLDITPESVKYIVKYNSLTLLDRLDVLKVVIKSDKETQMLRIFKGIINIWNKKNLVVPKHILFSFDMDEGGLSTGCLVKFSDIIHYVSDKLMLKGCQTLLLLYNGSDNISTGKIGFPLIRHKSNTTLYVSNKESVISCCHGIKSPFFNQFSFTNSIHKSANKLHEIFYGKQQIKLFELKKQLHYINSRYDPAQNIHRFI